MTDINSAWRTEEPFEITHIQDGVEGKDNARRLVFPYVKSLIKSGRLWDSIEAEIRTWNQKNQPPIDEVDLDGILSWCRQKWYPND